MPREVLLTRGESALVDDADYLYLKRWSWYFNNRYAVRARQLDDGPGPKSIYMHRVVLEVPETAEVDHINGDCLDNQRENLRQVTHQKNRLNNKRYQTNKSGFPGVYWHKASKKWMARITVNGRTHYLGTFTEKGDAATARAHAEAHLFGVFARDA